MTRNSILALALGGLTLSVLPACNPAEDTAAATKEDAVAIKVFNLRYQEVTDYGEWFGYLRGEHDTDIHPRISGFLISQEYKNGTRVKAGDVLFRIDPKLFEAELERSKANLLAAKASLTAAEATAAKAQLDVKRYTQLVTSGSVSEKDLTDAQQTLKAANAQVEAAKAQIGQQEAAVQKAQINLDYTIIRAPYDGIMGTSTV
ncbi:MAG: efflux RND transporter periplasmic adaptor subunit, partial [Akkermansia sp.]|nr:efflux RND transporter periplasmic adaptor subunit [Akkermansia sp.]